MASGSTPENQNEVEVDKVSKAIPAHERFDFSCFAKPQLEISYNFTHVWSTTLKAQLSNLSHLSLKQSIVIVTSNARDLSEKQVIYLLNCIGQHNPLQERFGFSETMLKPDMALSLNLCLADHEECCEGPSWSKIIR
ncbi:hypothetical protein AAHA92_26135 [Salvia divinorum]|uniref:Uncharacterized protein n=1 Tax=Salvia divinorum TaxID=28513 RepID=A0ABD1GFJ1_SALDI